MMKTIPPVHLAYMVDDDEICTFALQKMLTIFRMAENTLAFPSGKDALEHLTQGKNFPDQLPDVIFLDINMPEMNGWQFLDNFSKIRAQLEKKISVYMVSSSINNTDIQKARSYTCVSGYLTKPVTKEELARVMEEVYHWKEAVP